MVRETLFHLHIPKTGGTTLFGALATRIPFEKIVQLQVEKVVQLQEAETDRKYLASQIAHAELVSGHLTWAAVDAFPQPPAVLTVVRDPVERILSLYGFLRKQAKANIFASNSQRAADEAATRSLSDIILGPRTPLRSMIGPVQVESLSHKALLYWAPDADLDEGIVQRHLEVALHHLETCAWVGTTETLDRDLQTLAFHFGWKPFGFPQRHMVSAERPDASVLSVRARRELYRLVEADRELHARAQALADERHFQMIEQMLTERAQGYRDASTFTGQPADVSDLGHERAPSPHPDEAALAADFSHRIRPE